MKNYWKALLFVIVSAFVYQLLHDFLGNMNWLFELLWIGILLIFGFLLSPSKKKNNRWLGKVFISIFVIFSIGYRLNLFSIVGLDNLMTFKGLGYSFQDLLLVFSGWAFYQV